MANSDGATYQFKETRHEPSLFDDPETAKDSSHKAEDSGFPHNPMTRDQARWR